VGKTPGVDPIRAAASFQLQAASFCLQLEAQGLPLPQEQQQESETTERSSSKNHFDL
jgi:hypothetical protein